MGYLVPPIQASIMRERVKLVNRLCKGENFEPDALKERNNNIFKIIDSRISFYSYNTYTPKT